MHGRSVVARSVILGIVGCLLVGLIGSPAGARPPRPKGSPRIEVSAHRVLVDQAVAVTVTGVEPAQLVRLHLTLQRGDATTWTSQALFRADRRGRVRVATTAPLEGDYQGVDPMGLFWSAQLQPQAPAATLPAWTDRVHLSAEVEGRTVASTDIVRYYLRPGGRVTPVRDRGLVGTLFEPPGRHRRGPAMIVLGGSEGGFGITEVYAALLASHGYDALALAYFDPAGTLGGLPRDLSLIPLEYFATAIDWLGRQATVDPGRIGVTGASRGAELALLLGSRYPQLKAVVAVAPSSVAWPGIGGPSDAAAFFNSAWTENGQQVAFLPYDFTAGIGYQSYRGALNDAAAVQRAAIPVERINGPVLLISGNDDQLWPSTYMADLVMARLAAHHHPYRDQHLAYDGAGHLIGFPYEPTTQVGSGGGITVGGNPADSARAARDVWPQFLRFLDHRLAAGDACGERGAGGHLVRDRC